MPCWLLMPVLILCARSIMYLTLNRNRKNEFCVTFDHFLASATIFFFAAWPSPKICLGLKPNHHSQVIMSKSLICTVAKIPLLESILKANPEWKSLMTIILRNRIMILCRYEALQRPGRPSLEKSILETESGKAESREDRVREDRFRIDRVRVNKVRKVTLRQWNFLYAQKLGKDWACKKLI